MKYLITTARKLNGNETGMARYYPVPLYGRQMKKKKFIKHLPNNFATIIGKKQMKYLITTISALNQLLVITNLPSVNPDE